MILWQKLQANYKPQHFDHDFATGYILGSISLGARQTGLRYISWLEILGRQKCPIATREARNPFAIPYDASDGQRHLIPDALFGLEYGNGACFFALETDMGTEQHRDNEIKNATIVRKLRGYRQIVREETFKTWYGLPSPQVLIATASVVRMHNLLDTAARLSALDPHWPSRRFQFKAIPNLARRDRAQLRADGTSADRALASRQRPGHATYPTCDSRRPVYEFRFSQAGFLIGAIEFRGAHNAVRPRNLLPMDILLHDRQTRSWIPLLAVANTCDWLVAGCDLGARLGFRLQLRQTDGSDRRGDERLKRRAQDRAHSPRDPGLCALAPGAEPAPPFADRRGILSFETSAMQPAPRPFPAADAPRSKSERPRASSYDERKWRALLTVRRRHRSGGQSGARLRRAMGR